LTPTHVLLLGFDGEEEEGKWYSKGETGDDDPTFSLRTFNYSVSGNKLTLSMYGESITLTRK
jgi:hypothetical protein